MRLRLHPEAEAEFLESVEFYSEESRIVAERFIVEFELALDDISLAPGRYPLYEAGTRRKLLRKFPFSIVYDPGEDVHVIAVMHQSRKPGYWLDRI